MHNPLLLIVFIVLLTGALGIALYPLRQSKILMLLITSSIIFFVISAYWYWGSWSKRADFLQARVKQQQVQAVLKTIKNPNELIEKLNSTLRDEPKRAQGWYLLGRLYSSQQQWQNANQAFATAHRLKPGNQRFTINYIQSEMVLHDQKLNKASRELLNAILLKNPNQVDSLALLAIDAFTRHHYLKAIDYWQHLLKLAPPQSEDAVAIRKAIGKAQRLNMPQDRKTKK